ncbi:MAG TPA: EamA family transporter [Betaproteobacteria bacterium]|nr:EamA family transporter [Betaproteobacteria bacterium]
MSKIAHSSRPAIAALAVLSAIWGYNWVVMKNVLQFSSPLDFAALRTLLGAAGLFLVLAWKRRPLRPKAVPLTLLLGVLQTTGFMGLTMTALVSGGVGNTAILVYTMPFWVLVLAWRLLGERIRGMQWLAVGLAFAGLVLVVRPWMLHGTLTAKLLALSASVCWAASVVVAKVLRRKTAVDLISLTAWQMLFGGIPLALLAILVPSPPIQWSGYLIGALIYNVVLATALAWLLWLYVLRELPAGMAGMGILAVPLVGVFSAWVQLGERPGGIEAWGMLLIGAALALLSFLASSRPSRVDPTIAQE